MNEVISHLLSNLRKRPEIGDIVYLMSPLDFACLNEDSTYQPQGVVWGYKIKPPNHRTPSLAEIIKCEVGCEVRGLVVNLGDSLDNGTGTPWVQVLLGSSLGGSNWWFREGDVHVLFALNPE